MHLIKPEVRALQWRTARRSAGNGACVEVASVNGQMAVRDSKDPDGSWLQYSQQSWQAFVVGLKNEKFFE
jgi:hypothetical protein